MEDIDSGVDMYTRDIPLDMRNIGWCICNICTVDSLHSLVHYIPNIDGYMVDIPENQWKLNLDKKQNKYSNDVKIGKLSKCMLTEEHDCC
jgi:hypothetical protein